MRSLIPLFLFAILAVPSAAEAKVHWLDTHEADVKRYIGPLRTEKLDRKDPYVATVRGTFSFFAPAEYNQRFCGNVEPRPMYKSRKVVNGPVNSDVEYLFARPGRRCGDASQPVKAQSFQIAVGAKYKDYNPFGRAGLTNPHPTHKYKYALIGKGRRAGFRIAESYAKDNYGRLRIEIRRARVRDCIKGFSAFRYADEAQCVAAVTAARN